MQIYTKKLKENKNPNKSYQSDPSDMSDMSQQRIGVSTHSYE